MTRADDPYTELDAAYVIGVLPPAERREYEEHLGQCAACSAAVSELAGLSGILAVVPPEHAMALLDDDRPRAEPAMVPDSLPRLLAQARRSRRRRRVTVGAVSLLAAAAALVVGLVLAPPSPAGRGTAMIAMQQTVATPITARAAITPVDGGSRIRVVCSYASMPAGFPTDPVGYALTVTDERGRTTTALTWRVGPNTEFAGTAEVDLDRREIVEIAIVNSDTTQVILRRPA